jgi:drug/metabolite transporter (DMT)-like permease
MSPRIGAVGIAYALALSTYVLANKLTTAAATIFLVSTSPLWVLALAPVLLGERIVSRDLGLMGALGLGFLLVTVSPGPALETASDPVLGNAVAAFSGFSWALTVLGLRWLGRTGAVVNPAMGAVICGNAFGFLLALPFALPILVVSLRDVIVVLYLGVVQIGVAYVLLLAGLRRLSAIEASLLLLLEPVLNPLWAWLVQGESPARLTSLGGLVILVALAVHSLRRKEA